MTTDWRCARCGTAEGRNRRSFCCRACGAELAAAGLMWCGTCHQPRPLLTGKSRGMCRRCRTAGEYVQRRRRRYVTRPGAALPAGPDVWGQLARAWALLASDEWPGSLE